jgi:RNA polymerase sigma factor (sigma-70 family)
MTDAAAEPPPERPEQPELMPLQDRFPQLYKELLAIAHGQLRKLATPSLHTGDLAHDAFLKLLQEESRRHAQHRSSLGGKPDYIFKACFGSACRNVLRTRRARRAVHDRVMAQLRLQFDGLPEVEFGELHELLTQLAQLDSLKASIVEARTFGGLEIAECAELFQISPRGVDRRWRLGIAWLRARLDERRA